MDDQNVGAKVLSRLPINVKISTLTCMPIDTDSSSLLLFHNDTYVYAFYPALYNFARPPTEIGNLWVDPYRPMSVCFISYRKADQIPKLIYKWRYLKQSNMQSEGNSDTTLISYRSSDNNVFGKEPWNRGALALVYDFADRWQHWIESALWRNSCSWRASLPVPCAGNKSPPFCLPIISEI